MDSYRSAIISPDFGSHFVCCHHPLAVGNSQKKNIHIQMKWDSMSHAATHHLRAFGFGWLSSNRGKIDTVLGCDRLATHPANGTTGHKLRITTPIREQQCPKNPLIKRNIPTYFSQLSSGCDALIYDDVHLT